MFEPQFAFIAKGQAAPLTQCWQWLTELVDCSEQDYLQRCLPLFEPSAHEAEAALQQSRVLIQACRDDTQALPWVDQLLQEYQLDNQEGRILLSLAEALLRIPDTPSMRALIRSQFAKANWQAHLRKEQGWLVNAVSKILQFSGHVMKSESAQNTWQRLLKQHGEPMLYRLIRRAMRQLGQHFVLAQSMPVALRRVNKSAKQGLRYSFDLLGEAVLTSEDADAVMRNYLQAIDLLGRQRGVGDYSLSLKLSALFPRFEASQRARVEKELLPRLLLLIARAKDAGIALTLDAEELERQELTLWVVELLLSHALVREWEGLGLAVQAYAKNALSVLLWLGNLAKARQTSLRIRLVKGAYWDYEIKRAQHLGLVHYPVLTRKSACDCHYLLCARFLLQSEYTAYLQPQFATHNAHTIASVQNMAQGRLLEFQRLHGMGESVYSQVLASSSHALRIYAPIGSHQALLPYLVRRLLENGVTSAFVSQLFKPNKSAQALSTHPFDTLLAQPSLANHQLPRSEALFLPQRENSQGLALAQEAPRAYLQAALSAWQAQTYVAAPWVNGQAQGAPLSEGEVCHSPSDLNDELGTLLSANEGHCQSAWQSALQAHPAWRALSVSRRADYISKLAQALEIHQSELLSLLIREAGKTWQDALDEWREALDLLRYYASMAESLAPQAFVDWQGHSQFLHYRGGGVWLCISPWNFPLAIYLGQIAGALISGNCVLIKPAYRGSFIAFRCFQLLLESGIPAGVAHFLPGRGAQVGVHLTNLPELAGIAFTGGLATAQGLNRQLANLHISQQQPTLLAETGGVNAMIVDSTALPEQVVKDVLRSAFGSAGQRCSALRLLCVQQNIFTRVCELLKGAMLQLKVGNPRDDASDMGPLISAKAKATVDAHIARLKAQGRLLAQGQLDETCDQGHFVAPHAFVIDAPSQLPQEIFGPVLHLLSFELCDIELLIEQINDLGFGLTAAIHTRNSAVSEVLAQRLVVGNCYVNRDQIGAVVGAQPFGGCRASGTGPKAGGAEYLRGFCITSIDSIED